MKATVKLLATGVVTCFVLALYAEVAAAQAGGTQVDSKGQRCVTLESMTKQDDPNGTGNIYYTLVFENTCDSYCRVAIPRVGAEPETGLVAAHSKKSQVCTYYGWSQSSRFGTGCTDDSSDFKVTSCGQ